MPAIPSQTNDVPPPASAGLAPTPPAHQPAQNAGNGAFPKRQQITVMPDTGHHEIFIPFDNFFIQSPDDKAWADGQCIQGTSWIQVKGEPWIRYKYAARGMGTKSENGILVCIESNLGDINRGTVAGETKAIAGDVVWDGQPDPTPYAYEDVTRIPQNQIRELIIELGPQNQERPFVILEVRWGNPMGDIPILVDVIVDFGNTRTVVLLTERANQFAGANANLADMLKPLKFDDDDKVDSWFFLKEPPFAELDPPLVKPEELPQKTNPEQRDVRDTNSMLPWAKKTITAVASKTPMMPQMFVDVSPAVLGKPASNALQQFNFEGGGLAFLSSPKRYAWDKDPLPNGVGANWVMAGDNGGHFMNLRLRGNCLRFMPEDGRDWDLTSPPNTWPSNQAPSARPINPMYPRSETMVWAALRIIEKAYFQTHNHESWKRANPFVPRKIETVQVTYPSGWVSDELDAYRSAWQKAVNIFALTHLKNPQGECPKLVMATDEGVASQLPFIRAEIEKMRGLGDNWIRLMGKGNKVRVMSIDIGGGTTDIAIVEYKDNLPGVGVSLDATLLFKNSNSIAGDMLVKKLIEKILLPKMMEKVEDKEKFKNFFKNPGSGNAKEERKRVIRQVLIAKVTEWLEAICGGSTIGNECGDKVDASEVNTLNKQYGGEPIFPEQIEVNEDNINGVIREHFGAMIQKLNSYISAFDVDMVVVCGKPSELPVVNKVICEALPLSKERIVMARDYEIGGWYPFVKGGKISDAKTVTASGLAISNLIRTGCSGDGWQLEFSISTDFSCRNYWHKMAQGVHGDRFMDENEDTVATLISPNGTRIARSFLEGDIPETVYVLDWRGDANLRPGFINATFKRHSTEGTDKSEKLVLESVEGKCRDGSPVTLDHVALKLCPINNQGFWIDNPSLDVEEAEAEAI